MTESNRVWIRLADEGIPVAAIARSFGVRFAEVYGFLKSARERGEIIEVPPSDWGPGQSKADRAEKGGPAERVVRPDHSDPIHVARVCNDFGLTHQAGCLILLLASRRGGVPKEMLFKLIFEDYDTRDPLVMKNHISVLMTRCRRRFAKLSIPFEIKTIWGVGYALGEGTRALVLKSISGAEDQGHQ